MNRKRASIFIFVLPCVLMIVLAFRYALDVGQLVMASEKTQTTADGLLLSLLNIRSMALKSFAESQQPVQTLFHEADGSRVSVPISKWATLDEQLRQLKNSLSGHKGRQTAAIKVLAEANHHEKADVIFKNSNALELGLQAEKQWVADGHQSRLVSGLWYKRLWPADEVFQPQNKATIFLNQQVQWRGQPSQIKRASSARLRWDSSAGFGGFPSTWNQGLQGGWFQLNDGALFFAEPTFENQP